MRALQLVRTPERKEVRAMLLESAEEVESSTEPIADQKLSDVWQWDTEPGDPIFENPSKRKRDLLDFFYIQHRKHYIMSCCLTAWERYVPKSFKEASRKANYGLSKKEIRILQIFMEGMESNNQEFTVPIHDDNTRIITDRTILRRILSSDMKKIFLEKELGDKMTYLLVRNCQEDSVVLRIDKWGTGTALRKFADKLLWLVIMNEIGDKKYMPCIKISCSRTPTIGE